MAFAFAWYLPRRYRSRLSVTQKSSRVHERASRDVTLGASHQNQFFLASFLSPTTSTSPFFFYLETSIVMFFDTRAAFSTFFYLCPSVSQRLEAIYLVIVSRTRRSKGRPRRRSSYNGAIPSASRSRRRIHVGSMGANHFPISQPSGGWN